MLYPMKLDLARARVLQIEMDEAAFRAASFLDERMLTPATKGGWGSLAAVMDAAQAQPGMNPLQFIFHTGHVGSTLVSRLLDEVPGVLALREPLPLRTLALAADALRDGSSSLSASDLDALIAMCVRLWRRGFASTRTVVLKATSSCARIAPSLLEAAPEAKAIYLNLKADLWIATLLAGENSPADLRGHGPERLRRLSVHVNTPLPSLDALSVGELAAISWLAETVTQMQVQAALGGRVLAVDFDGFLRDVPQGLNRILSHFGLPQTPDVLAQILRSPVLTRYSKAPEHPYDPALRAAVINDSRVRNRDEIVKGMRWLDRLIREEPAVAAHFTRP